MSKRCRSPWLRARYLLSASAVMAVALLSTSCNSEGSGAARGAKGYGPGAKPTAMQILRDMAAAYRNASSYSDRGRIRFRFERGEEKIDETADFSVMLVRPDKLRMQCYQATVVCDGQQFRAAIADLQGQVLVRDAPEKLTLENIFTDNVLAGVLTEGISGIAPQLVMLLDEDALEAMLQDASEPTLLDPQALGTHNCFRVQLSRPDGKLVFWVDQQTLVLRRIDYPVDALKDQIAGESQVHNLALWAEFPEARFDGTTEPAAFRFNPPGEAELVAQFDTRSLVPPPPPPSALLGKQIDQFEFIQLGGAPLTKDLLAGKILVVDFWATWCTPCMESLPNLQRVYEQYKDRDDVVFLAVSIDESSVTDKQLTETFAKLGVTIPIARDPSQYARDTFKVEGIPNMFVLGPDGTVQDNEIGLNPAVPDELPGRLTKLLAGESIYELVQRRYEQRKADYERAMSKSPVDSQAAPQPIVKAEIAPRSEPQSLRIEPMWTCHEIGRPGNVLAIDEASDGSPRLLVLDGWKRVVELDASGQVIAKHDLDVPATAVVSFLRTTRDAGGARYYAGSASTQPQFHVFDTDWKLLFSRPDPGEAEMGDIQFGDLDGDGKPEVFAGCWGTDGVQAFDLSGEKRWNNQSLQNVFRLAALDAGHPERRLFCANSRGTLVTLDADGQRGPEISVGNRFLRWVVAADLDGDGRAELCGLAPSSQGNDVAIGFDSQGNELWQYALPPGVHQQPIELVTAARWPPLGDGFWLLAGADGSIHVLESDGAPVDRFHCGVELTGLAGIDVDGQAVLVLSSRDGVEALRVGRAASGQ